MDEDDGEEGLVPPTPIRRHVGEKEEEEKGGGKRNKEKERESSKEDDDHGCMMGTFVVKDAQTASASAPELYGTFVVNREDGDDIEVCIHIFCIP